jgi:hypothetical protein
MRKVLLLLVAALALALSGSAAADPDDQHGGAGGHLPTSSLNVQLVGKVRVHDAAPGIVADVATFRNFAYLTQFSPACTSRGAGGVYIIDITNPASPTEVGFITARPGLFPGEGNQVIHIDTESFTGDILAHNNEICSGQSTRAAGFSLWDVTNPRAPVALVENFGDTNNGAVPARQYHSVFIWQQAGKAYLVGSDDDEQASTDIDIFDISNPRSPVLISETGLASWPAAHVNGYGSRSFNHDMTVEKIGNTWTLLSSYWDAGYVKLNVNDPAHPMFIKDSEFSTPDPEFPDFAVGEGNAHYAEFDRRDAFIIGTDEDFSPFRTTLRITAGPNAGSYEAAEGAFTKPINELPDKDMNGSTTYLGLGCDPAGLPAAVEDGNPLTDELAVIQRGTCTFQVKANTAVALGYDGFVVFNDAARGDALVTMAGTSTPIPGVFVGHSTGLKIFRAANAAALVLGQSGDPVSATSKFDGWGYIHLFDAATLNEVDTYAVPEAKDEAHASGFGALSVHEVTFDRNANLAYLSWYDAGFRVVKYGPSGLQEVGHFIDVGGNDFWGVQLASAAQGQDLVLASDRDSGLYIFRYTGPR